MAEKRIKEYAVDLEARKEDIAKASVIIEDRKSELKIKLSELNDIVEETKKEAVSEADLAKMQTASFTIDGMTCAMGCAKTIETKLSKMDGIQKAMVDFDKKQATVDFDAAFLNPEKITKADENTGDGETYKVFDMKTNVKI